MLRHDGLWSPLPFYVVQHRPFSFLPPRAGEGFIHPISNIYPRWSACPYSGFMLIDYSEVMALPETGHGVDVGAYRELAEIYEAQARRLQAFGAGADQFGETRESRAHKLACAARAQTLWRLARQMRARLRQAVILSVLARIRLWVLASSTRKARVRALIGERAIKRWYARLSRGLALVSGARPIQTAAPVQSTKVSRQAGSLSQTQPGQSEAASKLILPNLQNAFGLIPLAPVRIETDNFPDGNAAESTVFAVAGAEAPKHPARTSAMHRGRTMQRALPVVRFYPFELEEGPSWNDVEAEGEAAFCWLSERPETDGLIIRPPKDPEAERRKHQKRTRLIEESIKAREEEAARLKNPPDP